MLNDGQIKATADRGSPLNGERISRKRSRIEPLNLIDLCLREDIGNALKYPNAAPSPLNEERGRGEE
jgi:hypothetical protein